MAAIITLWCFRDRRFSIIVDMAAIIQVATKIVNKKQFYISQRPSGCSPYRLNFFQQDGTPQKRSNKGMIVNIGVRSIYSANMSKSRPSRMLRIMFLAYYHHVNSLIEAS